MYKQLSMKLYCKENIELEYELVKELMYDYDKAKIAFNNALQKTKKASSFVENLNGRIKKYINIKHLVPTKFFVLIKVYLNTKRYSRSRVEERTNKSPLELLTNTKQPSFFELLGY